MGSKDISLKMRRASGIHQRPSADRNFPVLLADKLQEATDLVNPNIEVQSAWYYL